MFKNLIGHSCSTQHQESRMTSDRQFDKEGRRNFREKAKKRGKNNLWERR